MIRLSGQPETGVLAVVQPAGRAWRVVVAAGGPRTRFLEAREVPRDEHRDSTGEDEPAGPLEELIQKHSVTRVVGILPASSVVCRTCTLPDADPEQLDQALRLQAEAHLLGNTPAHRLAMSVLPSAPGETSRAGLVFAWPESAPAPNLKASVPVTWAPDIAALVALLDGLRPTEPLIWLDRPSGSVALAVTHANGAIFRATREEASTADQWRICVSRVLAETALSVGHSGAFAEGLVRRHGDDIASVRPDDARLFVPREIIEAATREVDDIPTDDGWWSRFGVAAGVAMAATSELAPLTVLEAEDVSLQPTRLEAIGAALARPRVALITAIICLVTAGLLPVLVSGLHLGILKLKYPDLDEQTREIRKTNQRLAMYRALDDHAWSMTKLLSDIVCNTPRGIKLEMVRLQQSDGTFAINGEVISHEELSATEVIASLQENLRDSGLFAEIRVTWGDPNAYGHYSFDLSAKILRPHQLFNDEEDRGYDVAFDFANWTLAQREAGLDPPSLAMPIDDAPATGTDRPGIDRSTDPGADTEPDTRSDDPRPGDRGAKSPPRVADAGSRTTPKPGIPTTPRARKPVSRPAPTGTRTVAKHLNGRSPADNAAQRPANRGTARRGRHVRRRRPWEPARGSNRGPRCRRRDRRAAHRRADQPAHQGRDHRPPAEGCRGPQAGSEVRRSRTGSETPRGVRGADGAHEVRTMTVEPTAFDRFQSLPRAVRWLSLGVVFVTLFLAWDASLGTMSRTLREDAEQLERQVNEVLRSDELRGKLKSMTDTVVVIGDVSRPSSENEGQLALTRAYNEVLKNYAVTPDSFDMSGGGDKLPRNVSQGVARDGKRLARLTGTLKFKSTAEDAIGIISDFEQHRDIESVSKLRITKDERRTVKVTMTLEVWVEVSSTRSRR